MNQEDKTCQNCKAEFRIEPEDFAFYEKIKVPPPTWCPECRMVRRMMAVNERLLFRRKNDFAGGELVSVFPRQVPFPVYEHNTWWSDKWDAIEYGRGYDFSKPFFQQWKELSERVPRYNVTVVNSPGCDYCPKVIDSRNSYLTVGLGAEECLYGNYTRFSKQCVDYYFLDFCELCYESLHSYRSRNVTFSQYAIECRDSAFLYDCRNCSYCFGCVGLRNKQFYIFNRPYLAEEYKRTIETFNLGNFVQLQEFREKFEEFKRRYPRRFARLEHCVDVTGNDVANGKHCHACFDIDASDGSIENCKYVFIGTSLKDGYDIFETGENGEFCYEVALGFGYKILFSAFIPGGSHDIFYSDSCFDSFHLFGCVGLKKKSYCIFNKQYSKEDYFTLREKIIAHMNEMSYTDKQGRIYRYGEFFPPEFSPFAYNETIAQEYFPLTKEQALEQGYAWRDTEERQYMITMTNDRVPDHIKDVADSILAEVISCAHASIYGGSTSIECSEQCTTAFKIIPQELGFYRRMNLPLPRLCPNCRHYQRLKQRNPLKLWHRKCTCGGKISTNGVYINQTTHFHGSNPCPNEFETSYAPDRKGIVYCEQCYQSEVV